MAAAPGRPRDGLIALAAFNLEIARAGYVASEPMLGEIRLRWWADAIDEIYAGAAPRRHEVVAPLAEAIRAGGLPRAPFDAMIAAREWDCGREGSPTRRRWRRIWRRQPAGSPGSARGIWGRRMGRRRSCEPRGERRARANWLRALRALEATGRRPLPRGDRATAIRALAASGQGWLARARADRAVVPRAALPALLPVALAGPVLAQAERRPEAALEGGLEPSEFAVRARMLKAALTGRW